LTLRPSDKGRGTVRDWTSSGSRDRSPTSNGFSEQPSNAGMGFEEAGSHRTAVTAVRLVQTWKECCAEMLGEDEDWLRDVCQRNGPGGWLTGLIAIYMASRHLLKRSSEPE
jgi:hypothetical protein